MAAVVRGDYKATGAAADDGLTQLGSLKNDELRWRLSALAAIGSRTGGGEAKAAASLEDARTALAVFVRRWRKTRRRTGSRPDFVYLKKRAGL